MSCCQTQILPHTSDIDQLHSTIDQLRKELSQARGDAHYYQSLHHRNVEIRERMQCKHDAQVNKLKKKLTEQAQQFQATIAQLQAKLKLRERQLFGKKSEQHSNHHKEAQDKKPPQRSRGQQKGKKSPSKRKYTHLPVKEEIHELSASERLCPCCQAPYAELGTSEESDIVEIEVGAHVRHIKRKKYRRTCQCQTQPIILTTSKVAKLLPKSRLGNSVWIHCLLQKFWHGQPLHRVIQGLAAHGLSVPIGTIVGGFSRLLPLLRLVYQFIAAKSLTEDQWNADETGWKVFEALEGKANNHWFLWVFRSSSTAVFVVDPSRSAQVVKKFFGKKSKGIISCDRYRVYFHFVSRSEHRFDIAYCWAHVRRDFLAIAKDRPAYEGWAMQCVEEIGGLYHLNQQRLLHAPKSAAFLERQKDLEKGLEAFKQKADRQLADPQLPEACRKAFKSLNRHWKGLTTFVKHPTVPMDNNPAERALRGAAVGRKNYYGSGSIESAELTAIMFTIIQTLLIWGINPQEWCRAFFDFIGDEWDKGFEQWLPWNMTSEKRAEMALKKCHDPPR